MSELLKICAAFPDQPLASARRGSNKNLVWKQCFCFPVQLRQPIHVPSVTAHNLKLNCHQRVAVLISWNDDDWMGNTLFLREVWLLLPLFKRRCSQHSHSVTQHHYKPFETDPWGMCQVQCQQVRSLMLQFCHANMRVEGLSLLFITIPLSLELWKFSASAG